VGTGSSISVWNDPWIPATRPRPANKNLQNSYPDLTVDSLINSESRTWNLQAIRVLVDSHDVNIIESIPLSRNQMEDRNGWHFTNNEKYSVQSGYQVERVYPDWEKPPEFNGPTVDILKAFYWKVRCPPEDTTFLMANPFRMYSGNEKSTNEGNTRGYMLCSMWRSGGINKPCVFLMSSSTSSMGFI